MVRKPSPFSIPGGDGASEIVCYTHKYAHNGKVGHFCVGSNVAVDFGKVEGLSLIHI